MKSWKVLTSLLVVGLLACPFQAMAAEGGYEMHGSILFGGVGFDYSEDDVFHLERYGTNRKGGKDGGGYIFFDAFDVDFYLVNPEDDSHIIDISRDSFNYFDQRVEGRVNIDEMKLEFRSTTLESHVQDPVPDVDPTWSEASVGINTDTNYLSQFNNDANPDSVFSIERTSYEGTITIKPAAYGRDSSIFGDLELYYRGYDRNGTRFYRYMLWGGDVNISLGNKNVHRWRAFDQRVDENMDTVGVRSVFAPGHWFTLTNDTSIEVFDNHVVPVSLTDISALFDSAVEGHAKPLNFIVDSTKIITTSEFHMAIGDWLDLHGGYTFMNLDQDTFSHATRDDSGSTDNELTRQYLTGRIDHHIATAGLGLLLADWWTLNVHARWILRDNRSSIDDSTGWFTLRNNLVDPRIDQISTIEGTVENTFRISPWRTNLNSGWTRKRTNRDLQFADLCDTCGGDHIMRGYTLYTSNTTQDSFFLNVTTHPAPGWTVRFKSSATTASDTGLVTEPTVEWTGKGTVSYYAPVLHGFNVSIHGGIKDFENDDKAWIDATGSVFPVDHDGLSTTAGVTASINPYEGTSLFATYTYLSNDLDTTFYQTDKRRFKEKNTAALDVHFRRTQSLNYDDESHSFSGGFTQQITDWWTFSGSGLFTFSDGDNTNGHLKDVLGRTFNTVDHVNYVASASTQFSLGDGWGVNGEYTFEGFEDDVVPENNGHINTFMMSVFFTR